jgi:hypothetical protein
VESILRRAEPRLHQLRERGRSVLLLGPRQTGKTTLIERREPAPSLSLMEPERWLAVETKWSDAPTDRDARHLRTFLDEHPKARAGVVVCRTPRRFALGGGVSAVPWQEIPALVEGLA